MLLKKIFWVETWYSRYLKAAPRLGLNNGNNHVDMCRKNHFLFLKKFTPHLKCWIWKSLLYLGKFMLKIDFQVKMAQLFEFFTTRRKMHNNDVLVIN